jgi:hypothetical protein
VIQYVFRGACKPVGGEKLGSPQAMTAISAGLSLGVVK